MKVLIACEYSAIVREAFAARGHDAWSCDLLPSEQPGQHIQGDAIEAAYGQHWDLMVAHPPCTYLTTCGNRWFKSQPDRAQKRDEALAFFLTLYYAPIHRVCIENPQGYANTAFRRPDQVIHPYYFGDHELKRTGLWLRNLPRLCDTVLMFPPFPKWTNPKTGKHEHWTQSLVRLPLGERAKARSKTFPAIAKAMADQWGSLPILKAAAA